MLAPPDRRAALAVARAALRSGLVEAATGHPGSALRLLWAPLGYWRVPVAGPLLRALPASGRVLDAGSPKVFALAIAATTELTVDAIDLSDPAVLSRWQPRFDRAWPGRGRFRGGLGDVRTLPFPDAAFDAAFAVSVLEHVPGDGDGRAMRELHRVVRPGGRLVVEVPYRTRYAEVTRRGHRMNELGGAGGAATFEQRQYDDAALDGRLLAAAPFRVLERRYVGEAVGGLRPYEGLPPALAAPFRALDLPLGLANLGDRPPDRARSVVLVLERAG